MKKTIATIAGAVLAVGLTAGPSSADEADTLLHPDEVTYCDSPDYSVCEPNEVASHEVLRHGVRLTATSYAGYTSGTFALDHTLSEVTDTSMAWFNKPGHTGEPGIRVSGDFDGDGTRDTLWGESIYGGDWWLNGNSSQAVKDAAPSTTGGHGSQWHGTLEQWAAAFPDGHVDQGGYTLGVPADGILRSLTYAGHTYSFTKDGRVVHAKPVVRAEFYAPGKGRSMLSKAKVLITATQPEGTEPTKKGAFYRVVKYNPRKDKRISTVVTGRVFEGDADQVRVRFPRAKKPMQVRVISYGEVVAKRKVYPRG